VPELPEVQAHAERLSTAFVGATLTRFEALRFTVLKTADPSPDTAAGQPLASVRRRGKYLLLDIGTITFVVHLMQAGRLLPEVAPGKAPSHGQARWHFDDGRALLLTEAGRERKAGVWCVRNDSLDGPPLDRLGPDALDVTVESLTAAFRSTNMRVHGYLRDQHQIAGLGRMLANEICHRAKLTPFAMTRTLDNTQVAALAEAIHTCTVHHLDEERKLAAMSKSADRPGEVHQRIGQSCHTCSDTIRSVTYSSYTVAYCPTCQTGGAVLADNTTSRFLK
jgi:formamidopyrimidine-DNA glycosylase